METNVRSTIRLFCIAILVASLSFSSSLLDFTLAPRFLMLAVFLSLTFVTIYLSKSELAFRSNVILLLYSAYTFFNCISVIWSTTRSESYFECAKQVLFYVTFLLTYYSLKKDPNYFYSALSRIALFLFFIALAFGIYQFIHIKNYDKDALYAVTGINGHKNLYSSFLFLNLFFLLSAMSRSKGKFKLVYLLCILISLSFILVLKTKAVWFGLLTGLILAAILYVYRSEVGERKLKNKLTLVIICSIILANVFFLSFLQTLVKNSIQYTSQLITTQNTQANTIKLEEERLILWDKTIDIIKKNPLAGVGSGNWQVHFPDAGLSGLWRAEDLNYTFQRPHNDFLWILSETGIIGFNLFIGFLIVILFNLFRLIRAINENTSLRLEVILCISFIGGYFTISFFDFPKERIEHSVWINIILGISYFKIQNGNGVNSFHTFRLRSYHILVGIFILIGITCIGVLRYRGEYYARRMLDLKNNDLKSDLIEAGKKAISFAYTIDPTSVPLHWYIGNAQAALGNYETAKQDFLSAYSYAPFNRNVLNDLASAYAMNKNIEQAKKYYIEAARISPRFDDPKLNLAALYIQEANYKEAERWLNSLFHDSPRRTEFESFLKQQD